MPDDNEPNNWHLEKKVSVFLILGLLVNLVATVWSVSWLASSIVGDIQYLKDRPDLTERVIRIEAVQQEQGRVLTQFGDILNRLDGTIDRIAAEQNRRSGVIDWARKQQNGDH